MRVLPMGLESVLVEDPPGGPAAWSAGLRRSRLAGLVDVVPAASTVLVRCASEHDRREVVSRLADVVPESGLGSDDEVVIPVRYDGPDLDVVAAATSYTPEEVVSVHSGGSYLVAFCGFAPGFGYLTGLPDRLHLPRRSTPRTIVPAGSVAIAAGYTAVYPAASPGGWHLLGTTELDLFDPDRDPPALLVPGTPVRFVAT